MCTVPQGSILSPLIWRIFDGTFSQLYKNCFPRLLLEANDLVAITHFSYADDHVTIVTIEVNVDWPDSLVGKRISWYFDILRDLLGDATKEMGCGINPAKSESIVPARYAAHICLREKTEKEPSDIFKWLGYFLNITEDQRLIFDKAKIEAKIKSITEFRSRAFQYTDSIAIRWRVFKVFICPFIELFCPLVVQEKSTARTVIHKLQHSSIAAALSLPNTASEEKLRLFLGEKSVEEKAQRMAFRVANCIGLEKPDLGASVVLTRAEKRKEAEYLAQGRAYSRPVRPLDNTDREDYIVRLFMMMDRDIQVTKKVPFRLSRVKKFAGSIREGIKNKIAKR